MPAARDLDFRYVRDESASAKLWGVYVSEAEKYDRALVESWRSDMEGMLIFAGLFSASLTAFIVESYKNLLPDSGDSTVVLLTQISLQLVATANGTAFTIPAPIPFRPKTGDVACNALWFISLGFSLTCALIATLLEQWARDYLHKTNMHSAPVVRARIFAYLFYGLKRFKLHVVVELVPLLLHSSLVFFFAGLVAFLLPVDTVLVAITSCILGLTLAIYACLTVFPIIWPDCPYRTPLSSGLLTLLQHLVAITRHRNTLPVNRSELTPLSALSGRRRMSHLIAQRATQPSRARNLRDRKALTWTCRHLSDDASIEAFLEGVSYVLHDPRTAQKAYSHHLRELVHTPNISLSTHIAGLLLNCQSGVLTNDVKERRQLICLKAIWEISFMSTRRKPLLHQLFTVVPSHPSLTHYAVSARALLSRSILHSIDDKILGTLTLISQCQMDIQTGKQPRRTPILYATHRILRKRVVLQIDGNIYWTSQDLPPSAWLQDAQERLERLLHLDEWLVFSHYIQTTARLDTLPYRYHSTVTAFDFLPAMASSRIIFSSHINDTFNVICAEHLEALSGHTGPNHVDEVLVTLARLWSSARTENTVVPYAQMRYISCRKSREAMQNLVVAFGVKENWQGILNYRHSNDLATKPPTYFAEALWHLANSDAPGLEDHWQLGEALLVLRGLPDSATKPSAVALFHFRLLVQWFDAVATQREQVSSPEVATILAHPALPTDDESLFSPVPILTPLDGWDPTPASLECLRGKIKEAYVRLLADFLHSCGSVTAPYEALETLACIRSVNYSRSISQNHHRVHPTHQTRFSEGLQAMFRTCNNPALLEETLLLPLFSAGITVTPPSPNSQPLRYLHWLDDPSARRTLEDTIFTFRPPPSASPIFGEKWSDIGLTLQESADAGPGSSISPTDLEALLSYAPQRDNGTG